MQEILNPKLFDGLSVYQDVVLAGRTVRQGARDCHERWRVIEPHLPAGGAFLDIGSNFGWFGLKICESRPSAVVASVEADPRSALIRQHEKFDCETLQNVAIDLRPSSSPGSFTKNMGCCLL